jgi:uncharacterized protein YcfJ
MKFNSKLRAAVAIACGGLLLAGCAVMPSGPSVAVFPGTGKSFDQFRADDQECRQFASNQISGAEQAANDSAVKDAVVGTAIGALAGAALGGNHQGAAVGAGAGLLVGSAAGANSGGASSYSLQRRYDVGYEQCMYAKGHRVPTVARAAYPSRPAGYYPPPPPPNAPPPAYAPPPGYGAPPAPGSYSVPPPNTPPPTNG